MTREDFANNWQWFNQLVTNVKLSKEQLTAMFSNLSEEEIKVWASEIKDCYIGSADEEAEVKARSITNAEELAQFYYEYPVYE